MGPLWKEIMANILPIVGDSSNYTFPEETPPKLALFSGHDTTLMPILATLGQDVWSGTEWAPYASMILIEIYDMSVHPEYPSGYAFRLIYNGNVLTQHMENCSSELCDSKTLLDQVMPFAKFEERICAPTSEDKEAYHDNEEDTIPEPNQRASETQANSRQKWGLFGTAILSAAIGSLVTCFMMRHHYENAYKQAGNLERELSMTENRIDSRYGSNGNNASNGEVRNSSLASDYFADSDEDGII